MTPVSKHYERLAIQAVRDGRLEIDSEGRIWRVAILQKARGQGQKTFHLVPCQRKRAELLVGGYLSVHLRIKKQYCPVRAHRLVWQYFHGDIPDDMTINHRNGNKEDNRPSNLELLSRHENSIHGVRLGLIPVYGETNGNAKLRDDQIPEIIAMHASGQYSMNAIGRHFGVSGTHIRRILQGQSRIVNHHPFTSEEKACLQIIAEA